MSQPARPAPPRTAPSDVPPAQAPSAGRPLPPLSVEARAEGARTLVTVRGELDIDVQDRFRHVLHGALAGSPEGIDVDLGGVGFCDCSGLGVLLDLHHRAREEGRTVVVRAMSPAVRRVLDLTRTLPLLTGGDAPVPHADGHPRPSPAEAGGEAPLRTEVAQLRRAMESRPTIDLARGILMATFALSPDDAWVALVAASQNSNTKLREVAQQVVDAVRGEPLSESLRAHLAVSHLDADGCEDSGSSEGPRSHEGSDVAGGVPDGDPEGSTQLPAARSAAPAGLRPAVGAEGAVQAEETPPAP